MDLETDEPQVSSALHLGDLVAIIQMQWRLIAGVTVGALVLGVLHGLLVDRQYRSTATLQLSSMAGQEMKADRVVDLDQYNRWNRQMFVQTQLEIIRSATMTDKVITKYIESGGTDLATTPEKRHDLLEMLEISPRQGTELLDLSITSDDPKKSAMLANLVANLYVDNNLDGLKVAARDASSWLDAQIQDHDARISALTRQLVDYQRQHGLSDVSEQVSSLVDVSAQMTSLNGAFAGVNTERVLLATTVENHTKLLRLGKYDELAKQLDTPLVTSLTEEYARSVTEHAEIASRYLDKHPTRVSSEAKLARIESELRKEVEATLSAERKQLGLLESKEESLRSALQGRQEALAGVSEHRESYAKLKLELDRAKDFYLKLTQRRDELQLQAETQLNNVRIIDAAVESRRPVSPNIPLNLAVALVGGALAGLALGFAREYLDDTISNALEVKTFLKAQFLGMIPKISDVTDETDLALYSHHHPHSSVAEAMRGIRTMIELDPAGPPRKLLVTSAVANEGKTSTVVRLAVAYANLGKRVIAIDADLRRPRLHQIFGLNLDVGLSSVLRGAHLDAAIHHTEVENLDVMPSGRGGERPNELLASEDMKQLIADLTERYDLVLIDSPPTVLLSDARLLSRHVDGVVVLAREHATSRNVVREAVAALEQVGSRVIGVVVNAVDLDRVRPGQRYYGYGYSRTYGPERSDLVADDEPKRAA
jgi:polysaccharide biosynthesis transport protein